MDIEKMEKKRRRLAKDLKRYQGELDSPYWLYITIWIVLMAFVYASVFAVCDVVENGDNVALKTVLQYAAKGAFVGLCVGAFMRWFSKYHTKRISKIIARLDRQIAFKRK